MFLRKLTLYTCINFLFYLIVIIRIKIKLEQIKNYYSVIRKLYEEVYQARPEKLLVDQKALESAYLFFLEEARQELKNKPETKAEASNA